MRLKPDYSHIDRMRLKAKIEHALCCQTTVVVTHDRMQALIMAIHNELEELSLSLSDALPALRLMEILHQMAGELPQIGEVFYALDVMRADLNQQPPAG